MVYDATGFLEKNRDKLGTSLKNCMKASGYDFIQDLFRAQETETGGISRYGDTAGRLLVLISQFLAFFCLA